MSLNILADENIPAAEHYFSSLGRVSVTNGRNLQAGQLQGVDVLLVRSVTRVDADLLAGSSVRFVGTATSGLDHIDREYLHSQGIAFGHAAGSNANSVVEYVLAAIATLEDRLEQLLAGGTVGIIGYGRIGRALTSRLGSLKIASKAYDPWLDEKALSRPSSLAEVLACDVVTLHPELVTEQPWPSLHLLGSTELQSIPSGSLLINASRGPVVDNAALLATLMQGKGPTVVLDVWEGEPDVSPALLQQVAIGTAHIAGYSLDGKLLATRMLRDALLASLQRADPAPANPAGAAPVLELPGGITGAALLRHLIQSRYDIGSDNALLRGAVANTDVDGMASQFDALRKHYRERRELAGSIVRGQSLSSQDITLIEALGCVVDQRGHGR